MKRILLLFLLLAACSTPTPPASPSTMASDAQLTLLLLDDHVESLPGVQRLMVSISQIHLHGETGWETLTQNAKRYEFVQLRKSQTPQVIHTTRLAPRHYDQVKLYLSQASLTQKNRNQVTHLPGQELSIPIDLDVQAGHAYTLLLNVNTPKSLYPADYNEYVFAPELDVELLDEKNMIEEYKLGMDEYGNVEKNGHVTPHIEFRIIGDRIHIVRPLLRDSNAGINVYTQSIGRHEPIQLTLKEVRLQNNNSITIYKGEQELLLDQGHVQAVSSEQIPADHYEGIKFYFEDAGRDDQDGRIELRTPIVAAIANLTMTEDQTLNVLVQFAVQEEGGTYAIAPSEIITNTERSVRTDVGRIGQRLYIPNADIQSIREADRGLFLS